MTLINECLLKLNTMTIEGKRPMDYHPVTRLNVRDLPDEALLMIVSAFKEANTYSEFRYKELCRESDFDSCKVTWLESLGLKETGSVYGLYVHKPEGYGVQMINADNASLNKVLVYNSNYTNWDDSYIVFDINVLDDTLTHYNFYKIGKDGVAMTFEYLGEIVIYNNTYCFERREGSWVHSIDWLDSFIYPYGKRTKLQYIHFIQQSPHDPTMHFIEATISHHSTFNSVLLSSDNTLTHKSYYSEWFASIRTINQEYFNAKTPKDVWILDKYPLPDVEGYSHYFNRVDDALVYRNFILLDEKWLEIYRLYFIGKDVYFFKYERCGLWSQHTLRKNLTHFDTNHESLPHNLKADMTHGTILAYFVNEILEVENKNLHNNIGTFLYRFLKHPLFEQLLKLGISDAIVPILIDSKSDLERSTNALFGANVYTSKKFTSAVGLNKYQLKRLIEEDLVNSNGIIKIRVLHQVQHGEVKRRPVNGIYDIDISHLDNKQTDIYINFLKVTKLDDKIKHFGYYDPIQDVCETYVEIVNAYFKRNLTQTLYNKFLTNFAAAIQEAESEREKIDVMRNWRGLNHSAHDAYGWVNRINRNPMRRSDVELYFDSLDSLIVQHEIFIELFTTYEELLREHRIQENNRIRQFEMESRSGHLKYLYGEDWETFYNYPSCLVRYHDEKHALKTIAIVHKHKQSQYEKNRDFSLFAYKDKYHTIYMAKDVQEILNEGYKLNHCVGTYLEKILKEETMIFVMRDVKIPNIPLYTIEVKYNDQYKQYCVHQVKGKGNSTPSGHLVGIASLEAWCKKYKIRLLNY